MTDAEKGSAAQGMLSLLPYFIDQTRIRLAELEIHRQAILNHQNPSSAIKSISEIAHKICGTADTFGFANLGALARELEDVHLESAFEYKEPAALIVYVESRITPVIKKMFKAFEEAL